MGNKNRKKKVGGRPASPNAKTVRIGDERLPAYPDLLGGPITPEEQRRNEIYAAKRILFLSAAQILGVSNV